MEGFGVSNYSIDRPSFAFTTRTTEFDDALLSRNVITLEQAMVAKGASVEEAHRLAQLKRNEGQPTTENDNNDEKLNTKQSNKTDGGDSDSDSFVDDDDDDDDDFVAKYRQRRLQELQQQEHQPKNRSKRYGQVYSITRDEWIQQVNEDSQHTWVVVLLTSSSSTLSVSSASTSPIAVVDMSSGPGRRLRQLSSPLPSIDTAMSRLAVRFPHVKFVQIPAADANPDWPRHHLPTLFLYRHGQMCHQLTAPHQLTNNMSEAQVEQELFKLGILEMSSNSNDDAVNVNFSKNRRDEMLNDDDDEEDEL